MRTFVGRLIALYIFFLFLFSLRNSQTDKVADPIIVHPDIRRMLLTQKALAEGARLMVYDASLLSDLMLSSVRSKK